jgi:cyclopropane fatty-acyl-phospholipid synthase-like methyltransferase
LKLIEKKDGIYKNTVVSEEVLISGKDEYLGEFLLSNRHWKDITLEELTSLIIKGPSIQMDGGSEEVWEKQTRISANYQRVEATQEALQIISSLPEYQNLKKILDLGAGAGMVAINLVNAHSNMKGVIFDQPAVAKVAKEFVYEYQLEKRIEVLGGDYIKDDIGSNYDLVWARLTFNFHQQKLDTIIQKIYDSLNKDGVFIYYGDGLKNERTYPQEPIIHMLKASLMSEYPLNLSQGKVAQTMLDCGFKSVRSRTIMTNFGEMDVDIARK